MQVFKSEILEKKKKRGILGFVHSERIFKITFNVLLHVV